jgi:hypothetical protein
MITVTKADAQELLSLLQQSSGYSRSQADALVHALVDIAESAGKIYGELVPRLVSDPQADSETIRDRLWDLREEFRHIEYHLHDSGLLNP